MSIRFCSARVLYAFSIATLISSSAIAQLDRTSDESFTNQTRSANGASTPAAAGGGTQADFDQLIELITVTIEPESWDDVGGPGSILEFPGGVFVDASGVMRRIEPNLRKSLAERFRIANQKTPNDAADVFHHSELRKVSLNRLEREIERRAAEGLPPTDAMRRLAGLERIDYLVIDDESGDVILAGPAGKWLRDEEGRIVSERTRRPVLNLDDLVVLLKNVFTGPGRFSCSITPIQENLATAKEFINQSTQQPLRPGQRQTWLDGLRTSLGNQRIEINGVPAGSRLARMIVEADYQMKLIGIGLAPGTEGVVSYLDSIEIPKGSAPPTMGVLRWWFTPSTEAIDANQERDTFVLTGQSVRVQSENEFLTDQGQRIHTGESDDLTREFADTFTSHFDSLSKQYAVFADLENIFELALIAAILDGEDVPNRVNWSLKHFLGPNYRVARARTAKEVPSVINHRVIDRKHVVAVVSGGVTVGAKSWAAKIRSSSSKLAHMPEVLRNNAALDADRWWWD